MQALLERRFSLRAQGSNVRTELLAGATTFETLSYILFVQPAVFQAARIHRLCSPQACRRSPARAAPPRSRRRCVLPPPSDLPRL